MEKNERNERNLFECKNVISFQAGGVIPFDTRGI